MSTPPTREPARYVPLIWRVAFLNAGLLVAAVIVTVVVLAPRKLSTVAPDEAAVLAGGLLLVALGNLVVLRRVVGPLQQLTALARRVDLAHPARIPDASPNSEAGELALTFNEMLTRLETERHEATGRVLAGQEAERLRIAQELHDQIGQELTAALLGLARVRNEVGPEFAAHVEDVQETVRSSLEDVRRISLELRPEALDELGLVSALAVLGERFAERTGIAVVQDIAEDLPALHPDVELVVYRIIQEALTNVARHAGATRATVTIRAAPGDRVSVEVVDTGRGIPPGSPPGTGIRGMQERAALVGGQLTLDVPRGSGALRLVDAPGAGTVVRLQVAAAGSPIGTVGTRDERAEDPHPAR